MNYFVINVQSNTICSVVASSFVPTNTEIVAFVPATDGRLNQYYERLKWGKPIDLYSIIPRPKISDIMPLVGDDLVNIRAYVAERRHRETVEGMACVWRVSERTVRKVMEDL